MRLPGHDALWVVLTVGALSAAGATQAAPETTRATMQRVFGAISTLLPVALAGSGWDDPARRDELRRALRELDGAAVQLRGHGGPEVETFLYLGQSLHEDANAIQARVEQGRFDAASYLTQRLTETCVACHTRLPAKSAQGFADSLLARVDRKSLTPLARARLETATRQFDAALATYEAEFARAQPADLRLEQAVPPYLLLALRVRHDAERADKGLAALQGRSDLSASLAENLPTWRSALRELAPALREPPSLGRARELLARGRALREFPTDARDLAYTVSASSVLFRLLEQTQLRGEERAEALYLLGQTEAYTRRSFELSDAAAYLEQAVRAAPHTPTARRAFAQLERDLLLGYTGSSGENVPADVQALLRELRSLSTASSPPPAERRDTRDDDR
jgi:hypothetical protein